MYARFNEAGAIQLPEIPAQQQTPGAGYGRCFNEAGAIQLRKSRV